MKKKVKIFLAMILVMVTIIISNLGQLFLSNEQFTKKDNDINLNNNN